MLLELAIKRAMIGLQEGDVSFKPDEVSRIIEMAWEDRTPFEAIENYFGLNESAVIALMRR